jgi:hypothetical protein
MTIQYGDNSVSQREVCEWVERFKGGGTNGDDDDELCWTAIDCDMCSG